MIYEYEIIGDHLHKIMVESRPDWSVKTWSSYEPLNPTISIYAGKIYARAKIINDVILWEEYKEIYTDTTISWNHGEEQPVMGMRIPITIKEFPLADPNCFKNFENFIRIHEIRKHD